MKEIKKMALKRIPSNYNSSSYIHNKVDDLEESYLVRPKIIKIGSRVTDLFKKKEEINRVNYSNSPSSNKPSTKGKNLKIKQEIFSEVQNVLEKFEDNREREFNDNWNRLKKDYQCLFSYENFMLVNKFDRYSVGEKILDLKKEKLRNLLKDYENNRTNNQPDMKDKSKKIVSQIEVNPAVEYRHKFILPKIIKKNILNNSFNPNQIFQTEIKTHQNNQSLNVSGTYNNNSIKEENIMDEMSFNTKNIFNERTDIRQFQFPSILKVKTMKYNLFPKINRENFNFYSENLEILKKLKFLK
jgi:hypothetical protein